MSTVVPKKGLEKLGKRRFKGAKGIRKRKRQQDNAQQAIALANREDYEEESSGDSDSDEWYEGDEHCEFAFTEGGYHKVRPGDLLHKRYRARRRLGWGHFSQVYLALDRESEKHVALKVLKTGEDYIQAGEEERECHEAINKVKKEVSHLCRMTDTFDIYSNRGKHITMVFPRMSSQVYELFMYNEDEPGFPLGVVKKIIQEVLMGLVEIHEAGMIHTDLKPENLMLDSFKDVNEEELDKYKKLYEFRELEMELDKCKEKLDRGGLNKNKKKRLKARMAKLEAKISADQDILALEENEEDNERQELLDGLIYLGESVLNEGKAHVKIVDFGTASKVTEKNDFEIGTRNYRAPECIVGIRFDTKLDVWAAACLAVELLTGDTFFDPDEEDEDETFDNEMRNAVHLKQIIQSLGRVPRHMQNRDYFNSKGKLILIGDVEERGLLDMLREKCSVLDEEDLLRFSEFLAPMFQIDPKKRSTPEEALKHPWLEVTAADRTDIEQWIMELTEPDDPSDDEEDDEEEGGEDEEDYLTSPGEDEECSDEEEEESGEEDEESSDLRKSTAV